MNTLPAPGVAVRVIVAPFNIVALQVVDTPVVELQLMPTGEDVTEPSPVEVIVIIGE
jgi:hypothetical protein